LSQSFPAGLILLGKFSQGLTPSPQIQACGIDQASFGGVYRAVSSLKILHHCTTVTTILQSHCDERLARQDKKVLLHDERG
jgi:hypothetical protein